MAAISRRRADGTPSWQTYVNENPKWFELELKIEHGKEEVPLFVLENGDFMQSDISLREKDGIRLLDSQYHTYKNSKWAHCSVQGVEGYVPLSAIRKPTTVDFQKRERVIQRYLQRLLRKFDAPTLIIKEGRKHKYKLSNVEKVVDIQGTPKADFSMKFDEGDFYISHKCSGGPERFQQYSGVSGVSDGDRPGIISEHSEVKYFLECCIKNIKNEKLQNPMFMRIQDDLLKKLAIFGPSYGNDFGINHCHMLAQGKPTLRKQRKHIIIEWSEKEAFSGDLGKFFGEYEPVLAATYRSKRTINFDNEIHYGARVGIVPFRMISNRTGLTEVT